MELLFKNVLLVNENTKHDCFFEISPHVNMLEIRLYINGWGSEKSPLKMTCDMEDKDNIETINSILGSYLIDHECGF
ncbi:hypothetical protein [Clostridium isatidis]|uniref:hypothetical protein n=1 Tax=Clostridium isatidis TaxID=182773 RepID=UPI003AAD084D